MSSEQIVTPWEVVSTDGIDYGKLIRDFGCDPIDGALIKRFEQVTKMKAHHFLRRGIFFSNKDLAKLLDKYEADEQIYLYTGRGPSSDSLHLGHLVPMMFTKYLQDAFQCFCVIQMSDDEKFHFKKHKENKPLEYYNKIAYDNAMDIIACGFDPNKTLIFSNLRGTDSYLYNNVVKIDSAFTGNKIRGTYGMNLDNTVGEIAWPSKQCAPAYSSSFPDILHRNGDFAPATPDGFKAYIGKQIWCLVPMAIDQDPYFRNARDFAELYQSEGYLKPATIHSKFIPGLGGLNGKMSSSTGDVAIKISDPEQSTKTVKGIREKINKYAFSGGHINKEDHQKYGGDITVDVPYQYLAILEPDDDKLREIARKYTSGEMLSGEIKRILADRVCDLIKEIQERREQITDEMLRFFFTRNRLFDLTRQERPDVDLETDEVYAGYASKFDVTFGYRCKKTPAELEAERTMSKKVLIEDDEENDEKDEKTNIEQLSSCSDKTSGECQERCPSACSLGTERNCDTKHGKDNCDNR